MDVPLYFYVLGSRLYVVGLQPTVIASRAPYLLLEQSVMTIERIVDVRRPSRFKVNGSPARSHVTLLFCPSLQNHNTAGLHFYPTSCGVIKFGISVEKYVGSHPQSTKRTIFDFPTGV